MTLASLLSILLVGIPIGALPLADIPEVENHRSYEAALRALAERSPSHAVVEEIGRSAGGRSLLTLTIRRGEKEQRREILLVAGLEGERPAGPLVALECARKLLAEDLSWLPEDVAIVLLPRANPDGLESWSRTPLHPQPGNDRPVDEDRDWATGEDPADDIDGDGRILRMRVRDPDGTYIADPAEPRLLRVADRAKGEAGIWRLLWEGIDNDGDGEINEDGAGGAQPARNFPHAYEEHRDEAGLYTLSEPCARAIAEYLIGHPRTAQVLLFSSFDSTTVEPKTGKPRRGWPREPASLVHPDDQAPLELLAGAARQAFGLKRQKGRSTMPPGHLAGYCYFQLGIPTISLPPWDAPAVAVEEKVEEEAGEKIKEKKEEQDNRKAKKKKKSDKEDKQVHESLKADARWLAHADAKPALDGFIPWRKVSHPQLGEVELGGFRPGFREIPPAEDVDRLAAAAADTLKRAVALLPEVAIVKLKDEAKGGGIYRIEVVVGNDGKLPLALQQGLSSRHIEDGLVTLELPEGKVISGQAKERLPTLGASARRRYEWWVSGPARARVTLRVTTAHGGSATRSLHLGAKREVF